MLVGVVDVDGIFAFAEGIGTDGELKISDVLGELANEIDMVVPSLDVDGIDEFAQGIDTLGDVTFFDDPDMF